jgi:hypothetical protein
MTCTYHGWAVRYGLPPYGDPRCSYCGHRLPVNGTPPVESRKRPMRTWIPELRARREARGVIERFLTTQEYQDMMEGK